MTLEQLLVLTILSGAVVLFVSELLRPDVVALLVLLTLTFSGVIDADAAFAGFANPAVVTVWAVFIISGGLQRSGVADMLANVMLRLAGSSERRLLLVLMITAGVMSAFMNNIGAVAILMPAVIAVGRKLEIAVSKLLMPLAFSSLLGGNMTLIGTPPNILAVSIMEAHEIEPFAFFDFMPTGVLVLTVGILYMLSVGRRVLPNRIAPGGLSREYPVREYLSELEVGDGSPLIGHSIAATDFEQRFDLNVLHVRRQNSIIPPLREHLLRQRDVLLVEGPPRDIVEAQRSLRLRSVPAFAAADDWRPAEEVEVDELHLAEVTLAPNSAYENQSLGEINFRDSFGLKVLAIRHHAQMQVERLGGVPLRFGDTLLLQGASDDFDQLLNNPDLLVLERPQIQLRRTRKAPLAALILVLVLLTAASGRVAVAPLMLAGALAMVIGGVLKMEEAYRAIDWKSVFLIAGMLPLGVAMEQSGTAQLLAEQLVAVSGQWGPLAVMASVFVLTALLTEVISNAAATVLLVPIAIGVAFDLGVNPQPFVMTAVIAASTSFLMPIGHQVNVIIYSAGSYRFSDYARVGVGLNLLMLLVTVGVVPLIWPF